MPDWKQHVRERLAGLKLDPRREAEIVEEVAQHLVDTYGEAQAAGASEKESVARAISELEAGGVLERELRRLEARPAEPVPLGGGRRGNLMANFWQDVRYGWRTLWKSPGFTLVAVLTLALGIGANTAMFGILNGVLLRPLPYPQPDELVRIRPHWKNFGFGSVSLPEYFDLLDRTKSFESIGLYRHASINLSEGEGEPERVLGARITPSLLEALRTRPALGRPLRAEEASTGRHRVALLSDGLWKRRFGSDPNVLGRHLRILNDDYEIAGVMPPGFFYPTKQTEIWLGYGLDRADPGPRGNHSSAMLARLRPGVTPQQAQAELDILSTQLRKEYPQNYPQASGFKLVAQPLLESVAGSARPALLLLMAAVGFVLLIACANLANLLLARMTGREKEIAIRAALGAGRGRILSQVLTESLLLAALGGVGALAVAKGLFRVLLLLHPESVPRLENVQLDATVVLFTAGLIVLTGLAVGLIPAFRASRSALRDSLKEGGRQTGGTSRHRTRAALVVAEVALATVLLMGAGLLIRSFQQLQAVDPGFRTQNILTTQLSLSTERYPDEEARAGFFRRLIEELDAQPDVESAGVVSLLPMSGANSDYALAAEGYHPESDVPDFIEYRMVTPDYFATMGIPVVRGRAFTDDDKTGSPPVVILSESLARKFWGDQNPIGKRVKPGGLNSSAPWCTVVGVVGDIDHSGAREGRIPIWYASAFQDSWTWMHLAVRTRSNPAVAVQAVRTAVKDIDPLQPIFSTQVMTDMVAASVSGDRFNTNLLLTFAALALVLAAVGIYGVVSYSVTQRTHEIGVRMALGAQVRDVLGLVVGQGMGMVVAGLALGLAASLGVTRFLQSLLFGVEPTDPWTFTLVPALLALVALAACWIPARRAARVDPMVALRYE